MPTKKEWAEIAVEAKAWTRALYDEYTVETEGKPKKKAETHQPQAVAEPTPPMPTVDEDDY